MMADDVLEGEYVEAPLAVRDEPAPVSPSLFGSADPVEIVEKAVRVADALKSVVVAKNLISNIQGKQYPQVEAWLTLASMLRLTTVCEWSRPVQDGWEARVFVRDSANNVIGAAEAQCLKTERTKKSWEDYAIRSMAQTRATSKALRSVLGFIMVLAGYNATPAEEMPDPAAPPEPPPPPPPPPTRVVSTSDLKAFWVAAGQPAGTLGDYIARTLGLEEPPKGTSPAQRVAIADALERHRLFEPRLDADEYTDEVPHDPVQADPRENAIKRHHILTKEKKMPDEVRRAIIERIAGKTSSKELTFPQLVLVNGEIERWKPA